MGWLTLTGLLMALRTKAVSVNLTETEPARAFVLEPEQPSVREAKRGSLRGEQCPEQDYRGERHTARIVSTWSLGVSLRKEIQCGAGSRVRCVSVEFLRETQGF